MGKSSKSDTGPSKFAQPYITPAAGALQDSYTGNQANISNISNTLQSNMGGVVNSTLNNPGLTAAGAYNNSVLSGQYLNSNPNLEDIIKNSNADVANQVNASVGSRGGAGGSAQAQIMARELAKNDSTLRYNDYNTERGYQQAAVGNAASLSGANDNNIQALMSYLTGQATIPQSGANSYAAATGSLLSPYTSTTQSQSLGSGLGGILGAGLAGWATGGFKT